MTEANEIKLCDETIDILHEFQIELNRIVVANHQFALEGINRAEIEEIKELEEEFANDDFEVLSEAVSHLRCNFEELRQASLQLAWVGVITRLQHWIARFATKDKDSSPKPSKNFNPGQSNHKKNKHKKPKSLIDRLRHMNCDAELLSFFQKAVDVRDSIIHGDSRTNRGNDRPLIAPCYRNAWGRVELSEEQLMELVNKSVLQISQYEESLSGCAGVAGPAIFRGVPQG